MRKAAQTPINRLIGAVRMPKLASKMIASSERGTTQMSNLHDPDNPRHARMFELLRQTQQAAYTTSRLNVSAVRQLDDRVAEKIKETALQSLRFSQMSPKKR